MWGLGLLVAQPPHPLVTHPPPSPTPPGVHLWHARRAAWTALSPSRAAASGGEGGAAAAPGRGARPPTIEPDAVYDDLLATTTPFAQPIPLPEMVDFLVDTWIEDGLY